MRRPLRPRALGLTLGLGLLQTTGLMALAMWALESGGAGKISVLTYTMPFWLLLMAWVVLGERLGRLQWIAVGLALCGLVLILSPWSLRGWLSSLLAVAGAILWAGSAVVAKVLRKRHEVDLLSMTAWQMLLGSLPLVLLAALTWSGPPVWSGSFIAALVYNVLPANAFALVLWFYVLHALPAGIAGLGTLLTPVVGVMSAWIQLGERPGLAEGLGMLAIVGALSLTVVWGLVTRPASGG
jgi:drug/metabolite transporter (DMT)-like permease